MRKPLSTALNITLLSFSLPLLFAGNAWAKTCPEVEANDYLRSSNDALFNCDADVIPVLIEALKNNNTKVRSHAVDALYFQVGIQDEIVVPALVRALKDKDAEVRRHAASGLSIAAIEADTAIPALIQALKDEDDQVQYHAALALRNSNTKAEIVVPALIKLLEDNNALARSGAAIALSAIDAEAKKIAIPALIKALKGDNAAVRSYAANALGRRDSDYKVALPVLLEALNDPYAHVRGNAALSIRALGVEDKTAILPLIRSLKDKNAAVRTSAAFALGLFGTEPDAVLPALVDMLKDKDILIRYRAAQSLSDIAANQYTYASTVQQTDQALEVVSTIKLVLANPGLQKDLHIKEHRQSVERSLDSLQNKRQSFLLQSAGEWISAGKGVWLAHAAFWLALILVYPKSPQVQAIFFWNPWMRKIMGLGYVGFALIWVPFLRRTLFEPFRESLLADAGLGNFKPDAYFAESGVKLQPVGEVQPIRDAIPDFKGQIVLEGASGLGKTMFLRHLCQQCQRIVVYLPAAKCADGVIEAIQKKLHGDEIKDPKFLQNLIYSGALAICIDGLNEVSAETRATIVEFAENNFKGGIILVTQPMEWTPPATAKQYVIQPLARSQIQAFLHSRKMLIPDYAPVRGEAYEQACSRYLAQVLNEQQTEEELAATHRILSNPMDLTVIAAMIAAGKQPDLFRLQEQQYTVMAEEYQEKHLGQEFPLDSFSEAVYQMRLKDEAALPKDPFLEELLGMERHKMVVSRQSRDREGKPAKEWYFRHDKIAEFFILQTVLEHPERRAQHLGDPRFRGVYFMLASFLKLEDAIALREMLIQYAADTKDHTVSDTFVQLLRSRNVPSIQMAASGMRT
ncbi:MAG: HEAT repeat domain-containing protein [Leptolyngbyaceae cyanobacterium RU_5_1]|nr:HEAT repeat domain-containing protein [Leptolyngbyaceae cyanobacterium RU_5_1]